MKQMWQWLRACLLRSHPNDSLEQEQSPLGLMATKSLIIWYPHQQQPDAPAISTRQMDLLDNYCCADCTVPLLAPYDLPCAACRSIFHLHDLYALAVDTPRTACGMKRAGLIGVDTANDSST